MKLASMFLAAAAATAPPKISLDLSSVNAVKEDYAGHTDVAGVTRQDFVERCPAGPKWGPAKGECSFPSAKAFDSFDKEVPVTTTIWLVDQDGVAKNQLLGKGESVDFKKRGTYLFKYDALDKAGNKAEQVVFVLLIDDTTAPVINTCQGLNLGVVEAASKWNICEDLAHDLIDGNVKSDIRYTVSNVETNAVLFKDAKYSDVKINTNLVGKYLVKVSVSDKAGVYGKGGKNNVATVEKAFQISDTTKPVVTIVGDEPAATECATKYTDSGVTVVDTLDTVALKKTIAPEVVSTVNTKKPGRYIVTYNAKDNAGNKAATMTRRVQVTDKTKPTIALVGASKQVHYSEDKFVEKGVTTSDTCDKNMAAATSAWATPFTDKKIGSYVKKYTVVDANQNSASVARTYVVVDNKVPIISVTGADSLTFEASSTAKYTDQGATCSDYVDGELTNAIVATGSADLSKPGTYKVDYACSDLSNNAAVKMTRTVVVKDTTCPKITLTGAANVELEAGFDYKDAGATASDTLDGVVAVSTDGDTVNSKNAFFARRSCSEIKDKFAAATDGYYYITTFVNAKKTFDRVKVWCDMSTKQTFYGVSTGLRVVPYGNAQGSCVDFGMKMAKSADISVAAKAHFAASNFPAAGETSNNYLCTVGGFQVKDAGLAKSTLTTTHNEITHAEPGKYIIEYHTKDQAGNKECSPVARTVIVRDTLPPVIKLSLNDKLIHSSKSGQTGINGVKNAPN
jgi:hypothetical protein